MNTDLLNRIAARLVDSTVADTSELGIPPAWMEAAAFAWLARQRLAGHSAGTASITGASDSGVLGAVHLPAKA